MTKNDFLNLQPGQVALRLTEREIFLIGRALDMALKEIEAQATAYVKENIVATPQDIIYHEIWKQFDEVSQLKNDVVSGGRVI